MNTQDFAYVVQTHRDFKEAIVSVLKSVEKKSWSVFGIYDLKERRGHDEKKIIKRK